MIYALVLLLKLSLELLEVDGLPDMLLLWAMLALGLLEVDRLGDGL